MSSATTRDDPGGQGGTNKIPLVHRWSPITTRLLAEGGPSAWDILDGVLGEQGCRGVLHEIHQEGLLDRLLPAKTKGETTAPNAAIVNQIFGLLQQSTMNHHPSTPGESPFRGDKSLFLSRGIRRRPNFLLKYPWLYALIHGVQETVQGKLKGRIQFDLDLTSVQLAVYPGDGKSGYVRHCDRGQNSCREEALIDRSTTKAVSDSHQRIVTAIYYMTDDDWHATQDGGALRLFVKGEKRVHVSPYRDRLVVFRSDGVEHQVMPSLRRDRTAITIWLYGSELENPPSTRIDPTKATTNGMNNLEIAKQAINNERKKVSPSTTRGPPPLPILRHSPEPDREGIDAASTLPTIFVSIASYRDSETVPTLRSLFATAKHPHRITVGLVLQLNDDDDDDDDAIGDNTGRHHEQPADGQIWKDVQFLPEYKASKIRCLRMHARDATGPCFARSLCQSLHRGEDYFLQIDSHMRFRGHWDSYLVDLFQNLSSATAEVSEDDDEATNQQRSENANYRIVLTTYPVGYTLPDEIPNETRGTLLVPWKFDAKDGLLRQRGRLLHPRTEPVRCHLLAAGFLFGHSCLIEEVPYDPSLHYLFFGEELTLAVRLFTHGYDLYAPPQSVVYHLWSRNHRPTQRPLTKGGQARREQSLQVVKHQLLQGLSVASTTNKLQQQRHGLGSRRNVAEFAQALGVDWEQQTLSCSNGGLEEDAFVCNQETELFPPTSLESKVASLDPKAKDLISFFLNGI